MIELTPIASLIGGALIGLSAVLLMLPHGRIAGMTGIPSGVIPPVGHEWRWRAAFLAGANAIAFGYHDHHLRAPAKADGLFA